MSSHGSFCVCETCCPPPKSVITEQRSIPARPRPAKAQPEQKPERNANGHYIGCLCHECLPPLTPEERAERRRADQDAGLPLLVGATCTCGSTRFTARRSAKGRAAIAAFGVLGAVASKQNILECGRCKKQWLRA